MNTPYDFTESAVLIAKLVELTREGKINWSQKTLGIFPGTTRFHTTIDGDLEAAVWSTDKEIGFRIFEKNPPAGNTSQRWEGGDPMGNPPLNVQAHSAPLPLATGRDLLAISIERAGGAMRSEVYIPLMGLLELARRSSDKIEPKIERVKQYLEKLAV
jgi:hypothetical protein